MNRNFLFVSFLFLAACPDNDPVDDTSDTVDTKAWLTVNVTVLDEPVETAILLTDHTQQYEGVSGESIEVNPDVYSVKVGTDPPTVDGLPTVNYNGVDWVSPIVKETLEDGDVLDVERPMNRYFSARFDCEYDYYGYDAGAPDFKGAFVDTTQLDKQQIDVQEGLRVNPHEDTSFDVMSDSDYFEVQGEHLFLQEASGSGYGLFVTDSAIEATAFSVTVVNPTWQSVTDLRCWVVE